MPNLHIEIKKAETEVRFWATFVLKTGNGMKSGFFSPYMGRTGNYSSLKLLRKNAFRGYYDKKDLNAAWRSALTKVPAQWKDMR